MITQAESITHIALAAAASTAMVGYALIGRRRGRGVRELWLVGGAIGGVLTCGVALADFNGVVVQSDPRGLAVPLIALSAGLLFGVRLFTIGLRGRRVGDHPHCRCGFDLFGKPAESSICPECGADLNAPRATVVGVHQRRPLPLLVGCFAMIVTLAYGSIVGREGYRWASNYDWTPHKSVSWLISDLFASGRPGTTNPSSVRAAQALGQRAAAGTLGRSGTTSLVDQLLTRTLPWPPVPGFHHETALAAQVAVHAWALGEIDEARMRRVMQAQLAGTLQVAPLASRGRTLRYWIALGDYALRRGQFVPPPGVAETFSFRDRADALDGVPLPAPSWSTLRPDYSDWAATEALGNAFDLSAIGDALPAGAATLTTRFTVTATLVAPGRPTLVETRDVALSGTTMLVEPAAMRCPPILVALAPLDEDANAAPAAPTPETPHVDVQLIAWNPAERQLAIMLRADRGALLADVALREGNTERTLDTILVTPSEPAYVPLRSVPKGPYEIVLRPTPERGADLFTVVPTYQVPIVVPSSEIETAGAGGR